MNQKSLQASEAFHSSFIISQAAAAFDSFLSSSTSILVLVAAIFVVACVAAFAALLHHRKGAGGALRLEGRVAVVLNPLEPEGAVLVGGELWPARSLSGDRIARGRVRIVGARGHWLEVEPETEPAA